MTENFDGADVEMRVGFGARMLAAVWFAGTALIPVLFFMLTFGRGIMFGPSNGGDSRAVSFYVLLPICMAAFFGFTIGSTILDERRVNNGFVAALFGALVAISSYVGMMSGYGVMGYLGGAAGAPDASAALSNAIAIAIFGAIFVGWIIVIAGLLGGWLLFRWASLTGYSPESSRIPRFASWGLNLLAAAVLLVAMFLCGNVLI